MRIALLIALACVSAAIIGCRDLYTYPIVGSDDGLTRTDGPEMDEDMKIDIQVDMGSDLSSLPDLAFPGLQYKREPSGAILAALSPDYTIRMMFSGVNRLTCKLSDGRSCRFTSKMMISDFADIKSPNFVTFLPNGKLIVAEDKMNGRYAIRIYSPTDVIVDMSNEKHINLEWEISSEFGIGKNITSIVPAPGLEYLFFEYCSGSGSGMAEMCVVTPIKVP